MRVTMLAVLLVSSLGSSLAQAQTVVQGPDRTVYKTHTTIDVSDVTLIGNLESSRLKTFMARTPTKFPSMIHLRVSFTPELAKSIEQL